MVEDRTDMCSKWKSNDGCRLDKDVKFSTIDEYNGVAYSAELFEFMMSACMDACQWASKSVRLGINITEH